MLNDTHGFKTFYYGLGRLKKMRKILRFTLIFILSFFLFVAVFDYSSKWLFPQWNGSYDLGNNLYMMDWERGNKIIVYCSRKTGRTCSGGSPVIPHEHPREVYVKSAKANDRWVIVKALTTESDKLCYYLIDKSFNIKNLDWEIVNCDSIIQSHIISTFDSISFEKILKDKNIELKFDK